MPLFVRNSRGVTLTEEGQVLYRHVYSAFEELVAGEDELKRRTELGIGHIRIGVSNVLCKYVLLPCLKQFMSRYPHITFTIRSQSTHQTLELLEKQQIDLGLVAEPHFKKDIVFEKIMDIEDGFIATPSYLSNLKLRSGEQSPDVFGTGTICLLEKGNVTRTYIDDYLHEQHIDPEHVLESSTMDLLLDFAKIGLGASCVIKTFVEKELKNGTFVELPLASPIPKRSIGFAYSSQIPPTKALSQFIAYYQHYYQI